MKAPRTILNAVRDHVKNYPHHGGFKFISRRGEEGELVTWTQLWNEAIRIAAAMPEMPDPSRTGVLIFCDEGRQFVPSLLATWIRGATAIPATGGLTVNLSERNAHILATARPEVILHDLPANQIADLAALSPDSIVIDATMAAPLTEIGSVPIHTSGGGLLQFTSGSTAMPKAVRLGPEELALNCIAIERAYGLDRDSVGVHWLPLYHDMGLVGSVLVALWAGLLSVVMRPSIFIQSPQTWLREIDRYNATITSAPNFAFDRLTRQIDPHTLEGLNLSSLEAVVVGGEPVAETTVDALLDLLGPHGLKPQAIAPSYGLAEAVLLVSSGQTANGPIFRQSDNGESHADLGMPIKDIALTIRNPETGKPANDGDTGEVWIEGPGCGLVIPAGSDWRMPLDKVRIHTGDHGLIENGNLYIIGRDADRIILRGRNLFAEEVEAAVRASQTGLAIPDGLLAFGVEQEGSQSLYLIAEQSPRAPDLDYAALNKAIAARFGVKCDKVIVLQRGTLPRTTSGKIRRNTAKHAYLAGNYQAKVLDYVT
ncbi:MAG: acyl-CoA synthetase (AMP-forming)/AMP-acid ligase II [Paracoccaceae bacterium]|jgi:acyl-CoA synthetase (AMP-forming)/AMP-acid ligase II